MKTILFLSFLLITSSCLAQETGVDTTVAGSTAASARLQRFQFRLAVGALATTTRIPNVYDEPISNSQRSADVVYAALVYQKNDQISFWARYNNGLSPEPAALTGLDHFQQMLFVGGSARTTSIVSSWQYGYQSLQDSLHHDILWTSHSYQFSKGVRPSIDTWLGVGNRDRIEWMLRFGFGIPLGQSVEIEPVVFYVKNGFALTPQLHVGLQSQWRLTGIFQIKASVSRITTGLEHRDDTAFLLDGSIPFLKNNQITFSIRHNAFDLNRTTAVAFGIVIGLGNL